jgi:hypothetical protein
VEEPALARDRRRLLRRVEELFDEEQPVAVLGTGGYASGPVVWWASRHGVPSAIGANAAGPRDQYLQPPGARLSGSAIACSGRARPFDSEGDRTPTQARRHGAGYFGMTVRGPFSW